MRNGFLRVVADVRGSLNWLPPQLAAVLVLVIAGGLALLLSRLLVDLLLRIPQPRRQFLRSFVKAIRQPLRVLVVVVAVGAAVPAAGLSDTGLAIVEQALLVAAILLVGWAAGTAVRIASDRYLQSVSTDSDDNLVARKHLTQVRILRRAADILVFTVTVAVALMTFNPVRQYGISLFASAGAASLVVGLAARPLLTNLIAGVQIAMTQPIRIEDAVIVEGEWGWIEEITSTYVVVRLWDWRRMILPVAYFLEKPFQNWTHQSASLIGSVFLYLDYAVPVDALRARLEEVVKDTPLWDGRVVNLQVSDMKERSVEIRVLVSARNAPQAWDLRCFVRERLLEFLQRDHADALPRTRVSFETSAGMRQPGSPSDGTPGGSGTRPAIGEPNTRPPAVAG